MPPELISQGKLPSLQFESVALCCQRHLHVLPAPPTATASAAGSPAGGATRCGRRRDGVRRLESVGAGEGTDGKVFE